MALAVVEHWFLVAPVDGNALWRAFGGGRRSPRATAIRVERELAGARDRRGRRRGAASRRLAADRRDICNAHDIGRLLEAIAAGNFGAVDCVHGLVRTEEEWICFELKEGRARIAAFGSRADEAGGDRKRAGVRPGAAQGRVRSLRRRRVKEWYGGVMLRDDKNERNAHFAKGGAAAQGREALSRFHRSRARRGAVSDRALAPGGRRTPRDVTIWCSNDYLGMGGHPDVRGAATAAANGTARAPAARATSPARIIRIVELEPELADLHGKEAALVFTSGWISNLAGISTIASLHAGLPDPVGRAEPQFDDRGRAPLRLREAGVPSQRCRPSRGVAGRRRPRPAQARSCSRASIRWTATSRRSPRSPISPSDTTR